MVTAVARGIRTIGAAKYPSHGAGDSSSKRSEFGLYTSMRIIGMARRMALLLHTLAKPTAAEEEQEQLNETFAVWFQNMDTWLPAVTSAVRGEDDRSEYVDTAATLRRAALHRYKSCGGEMLYRGLQQAKVSLGVVKAAFNVAGDWLDHDVKVSYALHQLPKQLPQALVAGAPVPIPINSIGSISLVRLPRAFDTLYDTILHTEFRAREDGTEPVLSLLTGELLAGGKLARRQSLMGIPLPTIPFVSPSLMTYRATQVLPTGLAGHVHATRFNYHWRQRCIPHFKQLRRRWLFLL